MAGKMSFFLTRRYITPESPLLHQVVHWMDMQSLCLLKLPTCCSSRVVNVQNGGHYAQSAYLKVFMYSCLC